MKIETKYDVGQEVSTLSQDSVGKFTVRDGRFIHAILYDGCVRYLLYERPFVDWGKYGEGEIYATREKAEAEAKRRNKEAKP